MPATMMRDRVFTYMNNLETQSLPTGSVILFVVGTLFIAVGWVYLYCFQDWARRDLRRPIKVCTLSEEWCSAALAWSLATCDVGKETSYLKVRIYMAGYFEMPHTRKGKCLSMFTWYKVCPRYTRRRIYIHDVARCWCFEPKIRGWCKDRRLQAAA